MMFQTKLGMGIFLNTTDEVLVALRRIMRATDLYSKHLVKTAGMTVPQILLLHTISNRGRVTIGGLAKEMSLSQATVTTILDRLERKGFVYRERSTEDKRKVHARLSLAGEEVLKSAPTPLQDQFARQFSELEDWEQSMIISSLQRVAQMMDAQNIDASPVLHVGQLGRQSNSEGSPENAANNAEGA